jgi:hypothetical protein
MEIKIHFQEQFFDQSMHSDALNPPKALKDTLAMIQQQFESRFGMI